MKRTIRTARLTGRLGMALDKALGLAHNDKARTARLLRACAQLAARWKGKQP